MRALAPPTLIRRCGPRATSSPSACAHLENGCVLLGLPRALPDALLHVVFEALAALARGAPHHDTGDHTPVLFANLFDELGELPVVLGCPGDGLWAAPRAPPPQQSGRQPLAGARVAHRLALGDGAGAQRVRRADDGVARLLPLLGRCGNGDAFDAADHAGGAGLHGEGLASPPYVARRFFSDQVPLG